MKRFFVLLLFVLPTLALASDDVGLAKYRIVKEAVMFLSSDNKTSPDYTGVTLDCDDLDYDCLASYAAENKITGAADKIAEWRAAEANSKAALTALKDGIVQQITASKEYRKDLATYDGFHQAVKAYVDELPEDEPVAVNTGNEVNEAEGVAANTEQGVNNGSAQSSSNMLPWLLLLASLVALGLSVFTFLKLKNAAPRGEFAQRHELDSLREDVKALRAKTTPKPSNDGVLLKPLQDKLAYLEDRLALLENPPAAAVVELDIQPKKRQPAPQPVVVTEPSTLYAKLPDLGNAFSTAVLTDRQNGEQIYQIEINGDRAVYAVSEDANVQKYALSDFNFYLPKACDFANQPMKNSRIHTVRNGTLTKNQAGWAIEAKALIEFR